MSTTRRKVETIRSQLNVVQQAELEALEQVGQEIKEHLDKLAVAMFSSFWLVNRKRLEENGIEREDLDFRKTTYWKDLVKYLTNQSVNLFIRDKMTLNDFLAKHIPQRFEEDTGGGSL